MRPIALVLVLALGAGCVRWTASEDAPLETSSIDLPAGAQGTIVLASGVRLLEVRLGAAHADEPARGTRDAPHTLGSGEPAHTRLERDHWVLRVRLAEARPAGVPAQLRAALEWNGESRGEIWLQGGEGAGLARELELTFDLGPNVPASNVYVLLFHGTTEGPTNR